tara:strand:- start:809 stop:997 length:189 start_codon:yes stop_codon:yes gene_type:complete
MKKGDIVFHDFWGKGMVVEQQGVVDRWAVRLFNAPSSISYEPSKDSIRFVWGSELEVISESR